MSETGGVFLIVIEESIEELGLPGSSSAKSPMSPDIGFNTRSLDFHTFYQSKAQIHYINKMLLN